MSVVVARELFDEIKKRDALKLVVELSEHSMEFLEDMEILDCEAKNRSNWLSDEREIVISCYSEVVGDGFELRLREDGDGKQYQAKVSYNPRWYSTHVIMSRVLSIELSNTEVDVIADVFKELLSKVCAHERFVNKGVK